MHRAIQHRNAEEGGANEVEGEKKTVIEMTTKPQPPRPQGQLRVYPGKPSPLGATWDGLGVNFALFSRHATRVALLLFDGAMDQAPSMTIELPERTGPIWHGYIPNLRPGQLYGYRVYGAYKPEEGP